MRYWNRWRAPVVVVGLVLASGCGEEPVMCGLCAITTYQAVAAGSAVRTHQYLSDTAARANFTIDGSRTFTFTFSLRVAPHGTITKILIVKDTVVEGAICNAPPCLASGTVAGVTDTALYRTLRNVQARVIVYTDDDPAGAMSGAIAPRP